MKILSPNSITQSDIIEYLNGYSDFSFEIKVLKKLAALGYECEHGGTYEDPVTAKSREFDIRALIQKEFFRIHLSVECKNFRDNFPLVVHCLQRKENESYNELILTFEPRNETQQVGPISLPVPSSIEFSKSIKVRQMTLYPKGEFVAKSTDQIGRNQHDSKIVSNDSNVFDKISQAINSSIDLIAEAHYLDTDISPAYMTLVCPVLVVPDATLW